MSKNKKITFENTELKFSLLTLVLTIFCSFLIVMATFTQLKIFTLINGHMQNFYYIPQIPIIIFIAGLLGKRFSVVSVLIYIFTGLFLAPVFALGGGLDYVLNFNFGYILAYIPSVYITAKIIAKDNSILRLILASITGVLIIHFIGIMYMSGVLLIEHEQTATIFNWITNQTSHTILPDLLFGLAGIIMGNLIKEILKKFA